MVMSSVMIIGDHLPNSLEECDTEETEDEQGNLRV